MWIILIYGSKKFALELTGEETFNDITRILSGAYDYPSKISYTMNDKQISDTAKQIRLMDEFKSAFESADSENQPTNLFQVKFIPDRSHTESNECKGPEGELYKLTDISIGKHFKLNDKLAPSSRSKRESRQLHNP